MYLVISNPLHVFLSKIFYEKSYNQQNINGISNAPYARVSCGEVERFDPRYGLTPWTVAV